MNDESSETPVGKRPSVNSSEQMHLQIKPWQLVKKQTLLDSYFTFILSHKSLECLLSPEIQLCISFYAVDREGKNFSATLALFYLNVSINSYPPQVFLKDPSLFILSRRYKMHAFFSVMERQFQSEIPNFAFSSSKSLCGE